MFGALGSLGLGLYDGAGGFGIPLIGGASLRPGGTFARASSGAFIDSVTGNLVEVASGAPRFDSGLGLLIEGQRTNSGRNPRAEGAVPGTPGTWPTHWQFGTAGSGSVIGTGLESNIPYFEHQFSAASSATWAHILETNVAASPGQVWAGSFFGRMMGGTFTNVTGPQLVVIFFDGPNGTGSVLANNLVSFTPTGAALSSQRISGVFTAPALTQSVQLRFRYVTTGAHNFTVRIGAPQLEQGAFSSSPILPPPGSPAVTTRLADTLTWPLSALGVQDSGLCTLVGRFRLPQAAPSTGALFLWQVDDGADNNRYLDRNLLGTSLVAAGRATAGVGADQSSTLTMTPGVPFLRAVTISGGRIASVVDGGAVVAVTGGPTSGLTTLRIGNTAAGQRELYGYVQALSILPGVALPDAVLPNLRV